MVAAATRSRRFNFLVMLMMVSKSTMYWGKDSLSARIDNGRKRKLQYTR